MSAPADSIEGLPRNGVAIFRPTSSRDAWCEALRSALARFPLGTCSFDNVDVSNTPWTSEDFGTVLAILTSANATVMRVKAFKCGLDDEAIYLLAKWVEQLPPGRLPGEIHLSHNEISSSGFDALFHAVQMKANMCPLRLPIWLRIEGNKLDTNRVEALIAAWLVCPAGGMSCGTRGCCLLWEGGSPLFHMRFGLKQRANIPYVAAPPLVGRTLPKLVVPPQTAQVAPSQTPVVVSPPVATAAAAPPAATTKLTAQQLEVVQARARENVASLLQSAQLNAQASQAQAGQAAQPTTAKDSTARAEAKNAARAAAEEINRRLTSIGKESDSPGPPKTEASQGCGTAEDDSKTEMLAYIARKREELGLSSGAAAGASATPARAEPAPGDAARTPPKRPEPRSSPPRRPEPRRSPAKRPEPRRSPARPPQGRSRDRPHHNGPPRERSRRRRRSSSRRSPRRGGPRSRSRDRSRSGSRRARGQRPGRGAQQGPGAGEAVRRKETEQEVSKIQARVQELFAGLT